MTSSWRPVASRRWPAAQPCCIRARAGVGAWWLIATLIAVFPANLHMALHPERYKKIPPHALYARLPFQLVFIAWVRSSARC